MSLSLFSIVGAAVGLGTTSTAGVGAITAAAAIAIGVTRCKA